MERGLGEQRVGEDEIVRTEGGWNEDWENRGWMERRLGEQRVDGTKTGRTEGGWSEDWENRGWMERRLREQRVDVNDGTTLDILTICLGHVGNMTLVSARHDG